MHPQERYDALLVVIPVMLAFGGFVALLADGVIALAAAFGTVLAAASTVGQALIFDPPTEDAAESSSDGRDG